MLHGYQAESELFRECGGDDDDGEDEYQQHLRRMREINEQKQASSSRSGTRAAYALPHSAPTAASDVRTVLEAEHEQRQDARQRLLEKEDRFQGYVEQLASGGQAEEGPIVSRCELEAAMRESARAQGKESTEFVQSFR